MLIRAYLPKFMTALFGGLFIALGIYSFGDSQVFDRVFVAVLIFTAIVCRENINVVSMVIIFVIQLIIDELAWPLINYIPQSKLVLYIISFAALFYLSHDKVIKIIFPVLLLIAASELYWEINDYPAPLITWYIWLILSNLLIRHLIFIRVGIVESYFPSKGESINLDWVIYRLCSVMIIIQSLMLVEYLIRHVFGIKNALLIYTSYPYFIQVLCTISIWTVFHESYKLLAPKLLKA